MFGKYTFAQVKKTAVSFTGFILTAGAAALPTDNPWKLFLVAVLGLGTTYGVFKVPNAPLTPGTESSRVRENDDHSSGFAEI